MQAGTVGTQSLSSYVLGSGCGRSAETQGDDREDPMKRRISLLATAAGMVAMLAIAPAASAHNRGLVWLPSGECVQVGSLKSLFVPGKDAYLDLYPEDGPYPLDEYGTSFAAMQGNSAVEKGACPFHPGR
jgi:hypothetical protein